MKCTYEATALTEALKSIEPPFEDGPAVASYYHKYAALVDERDLRLFAAWAAWVKWMQGIEVFCPLCELHCHVLHTGCSACPLSLVGACCNNGDSPWRLSGLNVEPLLDALLKAVQYEIDALGDEYDGQRLRGVLRGENIEKHFSKVDERMRAARGGEKKCSVTGRCRLVQYPDNFENHMCHRLSRGEEVCVNGVIKAKAEPERAARGGEKETKIVKAFLFFENTWAPKWYYDCPQCGCEDYFCANASGYEEKMKPGNKHLTTCTTCKREMEVHLEAEPPTVIANEGPDGEYHYQCPHCGEKMLDVCSKYKCQNTGKTYTVRRRTRFERWHKEQTELYCVTNCSCNSRSKHYEVFKAKIKSLKAGGSTGVSIQLDNGDVLLYPAGDTVPYLGESRQAAYEAAAEKWLKEGTKLYYAREKWAYIKGKYEGEKQRNILISNRIRIIPFLKTPLIIHHDPRRPDHVMDFNKLFNHEHPHVFILTPDRRRAIEWLDAKLEEND